MRSESDNSAMKSLTLGAFAALLCTVIAPPACGAEASGTNAPLTMSQVLKLGLDGLLEKSDPSEAGQDRAAGLYAVAKQLETENALAKRDLSLVLELTSWRDAISRVRLQSYTLAYIINGGGTMFSHGAARDCAEVEDYLSKFAKNLPIGEGKGSVKAVKKIDSAIAFLKTLKPYDSDNKEALADFAAEREKTVELWEGLRNMISEIPASTAESIATFAEESLSWLKEQ